MDKTYPQMLCEHFGVEMDEEFQFDGYSCMFMVDADGLQYRPRGHRIYNEADQNIIHSYWNRTVVRLPYVPKFGDEYWYKALYGKPVQCRKNTDDEVSRYHLILGNCFKTEAGAEAFDLKAKFKEMGVEVDG